MTAKALMAMEMGSGSLPCLPRARNAAYMGEKTDSWWKVLGRIRSIATMDQASLLAAKTESTANSNNTGIPRAQRPC